MPDQELERAAWGWDARWESLWRERAASPFSPARVTAVVRGGCEVWWNGKTWPAAVTGKFRSEAETTSDFPVVGDWAVVGATDTGERVLVHGLLPRRSILARRAAGEESGAQVLAANVDTVFVVTTFTDEFNARRVERYLAMAREGGVTPVVLLNKSDLAAADDGRLAEARTSSPGVVVVPVSARAGKGLEALAPYLTAGKTSAFLGSSGVGKSSLLNRLLGREAQSTGPVREDDQEGRHTTTRREMFTVAGGGLVIDTPGLREVGLWSDGAALAQSFSDVEEWAGNCRYTDCSHTVEPGCGVLAALADGRMERGRYDNYLKLRKEAAYLKRKTDPVAGTNAKKRWKSMNKSMKDADRRQRE